MQRSTGGCGGARSSAEESGGMRRRAQRSPARRGPARRRSPSAGAARAVRCGQQGPLGSAPHRSAPHRSAPQPWPRARPPLATAPLRACWPRSWVRGAGGCGDPSGYRPRPASPPARFPTGNLPRGSLGSPRRGPRSAASPAPRPPRPGMPPAGANAALRSADGRSGEPGRSHLAKVTSQPSPSSEVPAPAPALPAPALPWPALLLRALRLLHPALPRSCAARRAGTALPACPAPGDGRGEAVHCFSSSTPADRSLSSSSFGTKSVRMCLPLAPQGRCLEHGAQPCGQGCPRALATGLREGLAAPGAIATAHLGRLRPPASASRPRCTPAPVGQPGASLEPSAGWAALAAGELPWEAF